MTTPTPTFPCATTATTTANCNNSATTPTGLPLIPLLPLSNERIPPDPPTTPTVVCPPGLRPLKPVSEFIVEFDPPECCGGPRHATILSATPTIGDTTTTPLCLGRIESETEILLRKPGSRRRSSDDDVEVNPENELISMKYDSDASSWTITLNHHTHPNSSSTTTHQPHHGNDGNPPGQGVAILSTPLPTAAISANQMFEMWSLDGYSNWFNAGVEVVKGSKRGGSGGGGDSLVVKLLNPNLTPIVTATLSGNFRSAAVSMDPNLWPSQKGVALVVVMWLCWQEVQECRRRSAWLHVLIFVGVVVTIFVAIGAIYLYILRRDE